MYKSKFARTLGAILAVGALATTAACSSPGTNEGSSNGGADDPIPMMVITSVGSPVSNYPDIEAGGLAAAAAINEEGGINGRMLDVSFCNTRGDTNQAITCTREAVDHGAVAVLSRSDLFVSQTVPITAQAGIPELGIFAQSQDIEANGENAYPLSSGNFGNFNAIPFACAEAGYDSFGIVVVDVVGGHVQAEVAAKAADAAGIEPVGNVVVPSQGVTDYAPYAQTLADMGTDCALMILGPAALTSFYKAAAALDLDIQFGGSLNSFAESEAEQVVSEVEGVWVASALPSPTETDMPAIAQFHEELDANGVGDDPILRRVAGLNAWLAVHAAAEIARGIDGPVTAETMTAALEATEDLDLLGVLNWAPGTLSSNSGSYPRLPASEILIYEFADGALERSDVGPIADPLDSLR